MPIESGADTAYMHALPKVTFRVIQDDKSWLQPAGVQSEQIKSYGFNDFSDFEKPEHYIRYIEPIESELAVHVEYDMDEQDQVWLDAYNVERKKDQSGTVTYELFEIIMDKLEKEWFNLSKRIPQPQQQLQAEDSKCAVCDDGEGENSNAIVFCDGCNLAVHQDCYGVPYIPEGQWLCRKCTVSPDKPVSCIFCPNEGGAFKQTNTGHWAHLLCAIWVPEVSLGNAMYMEPVEGVEHVPKSRWKLVCSLCKDKSGACIQCDNRSCFTAFHVTCARQIRLLQTMKSLTTEGVLRAFCHKHLPVEDRLEEEEELLDEDYQDQDEDEDEDGNWDESPDPHTFKEKFKSKGKKSGSKAKSRSAKKVAPLAAPVTKKSAQAHSKSFRPGPPIVPKMIVNKILDYVGRIQLSKKNLAVERICRYWSLKREARRGAPLLKRLHLEPWTASASARTQTDAEKAQKLNFLQMLRNDLEKVRMLAELVRKREKEKLRQVQVIKDVVDKFVFPVAEKLRVILEKISALDRREMFLNPVTDAEAPHYSDVIKEPMCWLYIDEKLEKNDYIDAAEFKRDVNLVIDNAMIYNGKDTPFYRAAARLKTSAPPLLAELSDITLAYEKTVPEELKETWPIGDLEPPLDLLLSLLEPTSVPSLPDQPQDMLSSLFATEITPPKPPSPSPPPKPEKKKETAEDKKKRWEEREAAAVARSALRATRAVQAKNRAFAEEAGMSKLSTSSPTPGTDVGGTAMDVDATGRSVRRSTRVSLGGAVDMAGSTPRKTEMTPVTDKGRKSANLRRSNVGLTDTESVVTPRPSKSVTSSSSKAPPTFTSRQLQRGVVGIETTRWLSDKERRQQELAMEVKTNGVNQADEFKRFNIGWVLPDGSKRRRTSEAGSLASVAPSNTSRGSTRPSRNNNNNAGRSASSTRSRSKSPSVPIPTAGGSRSRKSVAAEIAVIQEEEEGEADAEFQNEMDDTGTKVDDDGSDLSPPPTTPITATPRKLRGAPASVARVSKGQEEDDEVETPREDDEKPKTRGRKRAAEEMKTTPRPSKREKTQPRPSPAKPKHLKVHELKTRDKKQGRKSLSATKSPTTRGQKQIDRYPPGTLVWAKIHTFPFFPAEIVDHDDEDEDIPNAVLDQEAAARENARKSAQNVRLVRFFDARASFGWITEEKLDELGEDEKVDAKYLAGKDKSGNGKFRTPHIKMACRKAYREAMASMHSTQDEDAEN